MVIPRITRVKMQMDLGLESLMSYEVNKQGLKISEYQIQPLTEGMRETIFLDESSRMAFWMAIYRKNKPLTLLWPINREDWL